MRRINSPVVPAYEIDLPGDVSTGGWALLQGTLVRYGGDYDARLYFDAGNGFAENQYIEVPIRAKGVIDLFICLPANIRKMKLSPMGSGGGVEVGAISITRVSVPRRLWRMMRHILTMILMHSAKKRKSINLTLTGMLFDFSATYQAANKLLPYAAAPQYQEWIEQFDGFNAREGKQIVKQISRFQSRPHFHLVIVTEGRGASAIRQTLSSLDGQLYQDFSIALVDVNANIVDFPGILKNKSFEISDTDLMDHSAWLDKFNIKISEGGNLAWVMFVRAGDQLHPHALYRFACVILANPEVVLVYSDDDNINPTGQRSLPRFKPDWSLTYFRSMNFVGDAVVLRGSVITQAGGVDCDCCRNGSYDLLLRMVDAPENETDGEVAHIPAVLLHRSYSTSSSSNAVSGTIDKNMLAGSAGGSLAMSLRDVESYKEVEPPGSSAKKWSIEALKRHLKRNDIMGEVFADTHGEYWHVRFKLPDAPPLVSVIVPTRDALGLIRKCVESLLEKTTYPFFEILLLDNQSTDADVLTYFAQITKHEKVKVLSYDKPFNFSEMNNFGVREACGEAVCLLNNDTEVISPGWLEELIGNLLQPKVGVVGAKLYYPNGLVQHAGDLVGVGGIADHAHKYFLYEDAGYCNRAATAQEFSAVTGACMVTWRALFQRLGGLDGLNLPVSFNDVDYCLRVREAGYRVVWTPHAELYHHESVSRGKDFSPKKKRQSAREAAYMSKRWKNELSNDPFYNPNLSYERPDFSLSHAPMVDKPWRN